MKSPGLGLSLLGAMITPAVLISASGTLIFSTSSRLARVVDRVRTLTRTLEEYSRIPPREFSFERRAHLERQLGIQARRVRLIQKAMASFYVSTGIFVATTIVVALTAWIGVADALPAVLGVGGTLVLFSACVLLIREAGLAVRGINEEMTFSIRLSELYRSGNVEHAVHAGEAR
jgi:hypothetical protein